MDIIRMHAGKGVPSSLSRCLSWNQCSFQLLSDLREVFKSTEEQIGWSWVCVSIGDRYFFLLQMQHLSVVTLNTDSKGVNPGAHDFAQVVIVVDKQTKGCWYPSNYICPFLLGSAESFKTYGCGINTKMLIIVQNCLILYTFDCKQTPFALAPLRLPVSGLRLHI